MPAVRQDFSESSKKSVLRGAFKTELCLFDGYQFGRGVEGKLVSTFGQIIFQNPLAGHFFELDFYDF